MDEARARIIVNGRVQGVGFRYFCSERARILNLTGYARNRSDGSVEVEVEGDRAAIDRFIEQIRTGPRMSSVTTLNTEWREASHREKNFEIR